MLKYKFISQIKYTEAILSNNTRKLLWFQITKLVIAVIKNRFIASFVVIFSTLSFLISGTSEHLTVESYTVFICQQSY